jgi:DNA polymerase-3 subunit gamma/tau
MSVFHLKYRPKKWSDLDLADVADKLGKILSAKNRPQSFLFAGPKGSGKTSAARILAKTVNCLNPDKGEACGNCDNCQEIDKGRAIDIIEMDGASNRGIEDIRNLKDKIYLSPSKLKYKVFIIDEVHMLTRDAFNALLKLIEEPPKHTMFVLCTTDAEKIPETVMSRLVRIDFRRGGREELRQSLDKVIKGEKIILEKAGIDFILDRSDGSFRNLQRSLNEIVLNFGTELTLTQIEKYFLEKSGGYTEVDFETELAAGEIKVILERLEKMADEGRDLVDFRQRLMKYFQTKILAEFGVGEEIKSKLSMADLQRLTELLMRCARQEKETEIDQLPLELVVIDFFEYKGGNGNRKDKSEKKEITVESKENVITKSESKSVKVSKSTVEKKSDEGKVVNIDVLGISLDKISQEWGNVLMAIKPFNHSVEAFLRASRPVKLEGRNLVVEVFYPFHKDRLEEPKNRQIVEMGLQKALGLELVFNCILSKSKKKPLVIKNDTPIASVSEKLAEGEVDKTDLYDVAKDIFG